MPHPEASVVPQMTARLFAAFRADVAARGVLVPLEVTAGGVVLDGRQRLRAALELGLERVPVRLVAPVDELRHILLAALQRRDLDPSQRAALQIELSDYERGRDLRRERSNANLRGGNAAGLSRWQRCLLWGSCAMSSRRPRG